MKNKGLLLLPCLALILVAGANPEVPGFKDHFTVNINNPLIHATIANTATTGGIYASSFDCKTTNSCRFNIKDGYSGVSGQVTMLVGDLSGPYCYLTIADGAWIQNASLTSICQNGASYARMRHNDQYEYTIDMG